LCAEERPATQRACKRCVARVVEAVARQLGHTAAVCRAAYIHPRVIDDFTANKLGELARQLARRTGKRSPGAPSAEITLETLRAIEPVVARYLDSGRRRRHA
jgi:DNA topoisomerase-1